MLLTACPDQSPGQTSAQQGEILYRAAAGQLRALSLGGARPGRGDDAPGPSEKFLNCVVLNGGIGSRLWMHLNIAWIRWNSYAN